MVVHEAGHFIFAKIFKMRVDEFAFGFPPSLFKKKIGQTTYSFNMIPLGGYVKIFGENGLEEEEIKNLHEHDRQKLFGNKPYWQRIIVLSGGVFFNILAAIVFFTVAYMIGSNIYLDQTDIAANRNATREMVLVDMDPKSPLLGTGIEVDDKIQALQADNVTLTGADLDSFSAAQFIQDHNNSNIQIFYKDKSGYTKNLFVTPKAGIIDGKKILGAKFADTTYKKYSFPKAVYSAVNITITQLGFIFYSLYDLVNNMIFKHAKLEDNISGPIGLAVMTSKVSTQGIDQLFIFAGMLSLSLAAFNILPIPALDGGRIAFVLAEIVARKKVKASTEQIFHGVGFLALLCLMVFVTYFDIVKAFVS